MSSTFEIHGKRGADLTIRCTSETYAIKDDLKARGYRFISPAGAMCYWELVIPAADVPAMQAEATWIKAGGHVAVHGR